MIDKFEFFIPKPLPGLNEIIKTSGKIVPWLSNGKKRVYQYTLMKKEVQEYITNFITLQSGGQAGKSIRFEQCRIEFGWIEANRRRDPSNVCAGGRKFILDAMVKCGLLLNDNWLVMEFNDKFTVDKAGCGVAVKISKT